MNVFVSYARRDNCDDALRRIQQQVATLGSPYIDDLQDHRGRDRLAMVEEALESAQAFVAVMTPSYLKTAWTCREFEFALRRDIPMMALLTDGTFVRARSTSAPDDRGPTARAVEVERTEHGAVVGHRVCLAREVAVRVR